MGDAPRSRLLAAAAAGLAVLGLSAALAWDEAIPAAELDAFEWINGWPDWLATPGWPFMQLGMVLAPFAVAGLAYWSWRRWQPSLELFAAGFGVWLVAKLVKEIVARPRPGGLLDSVMYRADGGPSGLGFVSGHAAVVFALATVLTVYLPRRFIGLVIALATTAAMLRVYVGAHLPLDSVGGAGLGVAAGALVLLVRRLR